LKIAGTETFENSLNIANRQHLVLQARMGRALLAYLHAVFEIASRLKDEGVAPTNRKILHELGGGSMKTIAAYPLWQTICRVSF
jgi:hypothetical protein